LKKKDSCCVIYRRRRDILSGRTGSAPLTTFSSGLWVEGNREMFKNDGDGMLLAGDDVTVAKVGRGLE
jgi:hypothetical protein